MSQVLCPHCRAKIKYDGSRAGRVVSCPRCRGQLQLPALAVPHPPVSPTSSPFDFDQGEPEEPRVPGPPRARRSGSGGKLLVLGGLAAGLLVLCLIPAAALWLMFLPSSGSQEAAAVRQDALAAAQAYDEKKEEFLVEYNKVFQGMEGRVDEIPAETLRDFEKKARMLDRALDAAVKGFQRRRSVRGRQLKSGWIFGRFAEVR